MNVYPFEHNFSALCQLQNMFLLHLFLVIDDLHEVRTNLVEVEIKWRNIGLALGLRDPDLETVQANNREDVASCLTDMLRIWLNGAYNTTKNGKPSWQKLSKAVRHRNGGNKPALADKILQLI